MVKSITKNELTLEVEVSVIPKLKEYNTITLSEGDTLIMYVDPNKWDIEEAQALFKQVEKAFPHNNILCMFDGIEIGVIKRDEK